jgi:hypothetical protein
MWSYNVQLSFQSGFVGVSMRKSKGEERAATSRPAPRNGINDEPERVRTAGITAASCPRSPQPVTATRPALAQANAGTRVNRLMIFFAISSFRR